MLVALLNADHWRRIRLRKTFWSLLGLLVFSCPTSLIGQGIPQDTFPLRPMFTPFTKRPELRDRSQALKIVVSHYPRELRDAGIGGEVTVWMFVDVDGQVKNTYVYKSSGNNELDQAAMAAAREFEFIPARYHEEVVRVWVAVPISFKVVR